MNAPESGKKYDHASIESKWQRIWEEGGIYTVTDTIEGKQNFYQLVEFSYPSGDLHTGHWYAFSVPDIYARYKRMQGFNVLYPMGFDAFGLPAENAAIKNGGDPREWTDRQMARMREQLRSMGAMFDWSREVVTCSPEYYKWTQWMFNQFLKNDLVYRDVTMVNWCPKDQTILANEQVVDGTCDRCGTEVIQREQPQWMLRITKYADRLIDDLDTLEWPHAIKEAQKNWIGRSEGSEIDFSVIPKIDFTPNQKTKDIFDLKKEIDKYITEKKIKAVYSGGLALAIHIGKPYRDHDDIDLCPIGEDSFRLLCNFFETEGFSVSSYEDKDKKYFLKFTKGDITVDLIQIGIDEKGIYDLEKSRPDYWNIPESEIFNNKVCSYFSPATIIKLKFSDRQKDILDKKIVADYLDKKIKVFTTRADTLFGVTYIVLAPEHALVQKLLDQVENKAEVETYIDATKKKLELERQQSKEKTGVELKGITAINPANGEEIPVWIADYVLAGYGTGAVMAVPAHDERDNEFAQVKSLPIKEVIEFKSEELSFNIKNNCIELDFDFWIKKIIFDVDNLDTKDGPSTAALFIDGVQVATSNYINSKLIFDISKKPFSIVGPNHRIEIRINNVDIPISTVVFSATVQRLVNSEIFNGLIPKQTKQKITESVGGKLVNTYRLRDWGISRQRYWGCPIPIVYDPEGKAHPVPDEHLPWLLPTDVDHTPDGTAPLARSKELFERTEKIFGAGWKPEVETMDTFVDSSWYFYRYLDNKNEKEFATKEKMDAWMPIDLYMGGAEHTTMHLLYSRFWTKALYDLGLVKDLEAYKVRRNRGLILGPDGNKMSKSKGNVINPDEIVDRLGADTVRMYLAFMGPYGITANYPWDPNGVVGVRRFLERVWRLAEKIDLEKKVCRTDALVQKTIKGVGEDIEEFKFNTAIAKMMILVNAFEKEETLIKESYTALLHLLAPFAPHMSEELWHELGEKQSIHLASWPTYDESKIVEDEVTIGIQVNGKLRGEVTAAKDTSKEALEALALDLPKIKEHTNGKTIQKVIVVPNRIINIVLED